MAKQTEIRLFLDTELSAAQMVSLGRDHVHYLLNVMRLEDRDQIFVFGPGTGEWRAELHKISKKSAAISILAQTKAYTPPPDLWLLFAPVKKARTDFIVEKATELGVAEIYPVTTEYTNAERIRQDRLQAHAIEAAEQCASTYVPPVHGLTKLSTQLANWPQDRRLVFCNERQAAAPVTDLQRADGRKWAILIGPEGGFSPREVDQLCAHPACLEMSLGPRILRADTAAVAAISLWQYARGDWR